MGNKGAKLRIENTGGFQADNLAQLRIFGDPVLRQPARPVTQFDDRLERLAKVMASTMEQEDGVGLAANQIGVLSRIIVWRLPEAEEDLNVFVNPVILKASESMVTDTEGCLSVPGVTVEVPRAEEVIVEAQDLRGRAFTVHLSGLAARIIQHEVDHLDGRLILDRTTPEERLRALRELRERTFGLGT